MVAAASIQSLWLLLAAALHVATCLAADGSELTSLYTPLSLSGCAAPSPEVAKAYAARDLAVEECPAPSPYRLFVVSTDARSWVDVRRNDRTWSTEQRVVYSQEVLALGQFPNVAGSNRAEWRLNQYGRPRALIVRLKLVAPPENAREAATVSRLLVIGLSDDAACDLGLARSNEEARQLADKSPDSCPTVLPVFPEGN
ncbi:hypothetical protein [Accumulibacter sp.]|uniref:Uncharacterized protein n=1 Tax=Candidatus Accumulibacter proximus TaxID=2954385 RepID=A0A935PZB0_9PROT|nr:hypothetical protein [Accumulibacter sp.]MBK7674656.1 hypothetical protein [Candidatus Accumulibacter proximus]MBL8375549.1 hypothetical protein [Accumulibacter sp.]